MSDSLLYTRDGHPLQRDGDKLWSRAGVYVGLIKGTKVFGPNGRYVGTIVENRVVYRRLDSGTLSAPSWGNPRTFSSDASAGPSALWGDEPPFPR